MYANFFDDSGLNYSKYFCKLVILGDYFKPGDIIYMNGAYATLYKD